MTTPSTDLPSIPNAIAPLFTPALAAELVALRRDLHRHPELSWRETRTTGALEQVLGTLGIDDVRRVLETAVVARVPGRVRGAPEVAVRGDIDALPVREATGLPFASSVDGVMHACGHDVHATWAVGAAALLRASPAHGDVLVVLQPAEELGQGAARVVESGALDEARAIFGAHVDRRFEVGQVVADVGPVNASTDTFEIELVGAGAHGARPHESHDPVVALAAIVMAAQTLVARRLDPALPGVVTVGAVHAGSAPNVIPERATMAGTIRATLPATRELLTSELGRLAEQVAAAYGCAARVTFKDRTPPVVNEPQATAWARTAAERVLGSAALVPFGTTNMGGEDFAYYLEKMPGCFMRIGAREPGGERIAAHSPRFYAAEESLFIGAAVLAEAARVASEALAS